MEKLILLKYPYCPKQSTDSEQSYQNSNGIFHRNRTNPKMCMGPRKTQIAKAILRKKNKAGGIIHAVWFQAILQATLIKQYGTGTKTRHIDQWNRIDSKNKPT